MARKAFFLAGGAAVVMVAFTFTLSVIDRGLGSTFHTILLYISP
jgi:hypothetical protein